ncbi:hypothetical protein A616_16795 [Brevibacillus brevis X23]|nr:hypothetical protein A616_16795 [Brevibacillus brevis X23]
MSLVANERETAMHCDDETKTWSIYTMQQRVITKLKKAGIEPTTVQGDGGHWYKNIPFEQVSFRQKSNGRNMTEEQKQAAAERMKKAREAKGGQ